MISFFVCATGSDIKDYFYLFNVGQGSCNLVKYRSEAQTIGVLYDAGSSSGVTHPKFLEEAKLPDNLLKEKKFQNVAEESSSCSLPERRLRPYASESPTGEGRVSNRDVDAVKQPSRIKESKEFIKEKLKDLDYLLVFLSHPDSDHINILSDIVPTNIPMTVFLCGDWLGSAGANDKGDDLSQPVKKTLKYCFNRTNTSFSLPYYWDYTYGAETYQKIKDQLKQAFSSDDDSSTKAIFEKFCLKFGFEMYAPKAMFQGDARKLLQEARDVKDIDQQTKDIESTTLSNVYVWALNQVADSANDQSTIISCTCPDINMSFVFTGDAHNETFKKMVGAIERIQPQASTEDAAQSQSTVAKPEFRKHLQSLGFNAANTDGHIVWLSLPHHGAEDNISPTAYGFFQPCGFLISVGSTSSFGHPSHSLIREIREFYRSDVHAQNLQSKFYERFQAVSHKSSGFISISKKAIKAGKMEYEALHMNMFGHSGRSVPILCPNVRGDISIAKTLDGVVVQSHGFNPVKKYVDKGIERTFVVDYDKHVTLKGQYDLLGTSGVYENKSETDPCFVWKVVTHLTGCIYYAAYELTESSEE